MAGWLCWWVFHIPQWCARCAIAGRVMTRSSEQHCRRCSLSVPVTGGGLVNPTGAWLPPAMKRTIALTLLDWVALPMPRWAPLGKHLTTIKGNKTSESRTYSHNACLLQSPSQILWLLYHHWKSLVWKAAKFLDFFLKIIAPVFLI